MYVAIEAVWSLIKQIYGVSVSVCEAPGLESNQLMSQLIPRLQAYYTLYIW